MSDLTAQPSSAADVPQKNDVDEQSTQRPVPAEKRSLFAGIFPFLRGRPSTSLRQDLVEALSDKESTDQAFSPEERAMLVNILQLQGVRVEDVMIPRSDIEAVEIETPLGEVLELFEQSGHSRMPVYSETLDDPRGMIHIRDVLNHITRSGRARNGGPSKPDLSRVDLDKSIGELNLLRKVLFVPPSMQASTLMARMQATHIQMALVIDEYGGTDGLVSLEDILEMVVGDIEDEHDDEEPMIAQEADGSYVVDARAELDELAERIGPHFVVGEHGEEVDTVGGLIFSVLGRIPTRGEVVEALPDYQFHVLEADRRRIRKVRIVPLNGSERDPEPDADSAAGGI
ncbi:hemolysin family protein [Brucella endophytica]|nr:hemolysin family protein [Brucella endophytica]